MPRKAREKSDTGIYAVTLRSEEEIFSSERARELLGEYARRRLGDGMIAVGFDRNRVHMLVKESADGISKDIGSIVISFCRRYNRETGSNGNKFKGRFKSVPIENRDTYFECERYLTLGGEPPRPFTMGRPGRPRKGGAPTDSERGERSGAVRRAAAARAPEVGRKETPPPRRRNNMPSWLL